MYATFPNLTNETIIKKRTTLPNTSIAAANLQRLLKLDS